MLPLASVLFRFSSNRWACNLAPLARNNRVTVVSGRTDTTFQLHNAFLIPEHLPINQN